MGDVARCAPGVHSLRRRADPRRSHRRRAGVLPLPCRHGADAGASGGCRAHPPARARAGRPARPGPAGGHARHRRHARRTEPHRLAPQRPRGSGGPRSGVPTSSGSRRACRSTPTAGGSRWPGSGRPPRTTRLRSSCSTRPNACTSLTSRRRCTPSTPPAPGCCLASGDVAAAAVWAREHELQCRRRAPLPPGVRAPHPGPGAAGPAPGHRALPSLFDRRSWLLDRLLSAAETGNRFGTVIEVEVLRARAHRAAGDDAAALTALDHAVVLGEADGWLRFFVDAGPVLTPLLRDVAERRPGSELVSRLLARPEPAREDSSPKAPAPAARGSGRPAERARARRAQAPRVRPRRPGHRARAGGVAEHGPDPHQAHLHQARRDEPSRRGHPSPPAGAALPVRPALRSAPKITPSVTSRGDVHSPHCFLGSGA